MSATITEIEESIKSLSLADKKVLLKTLLQEIDGHQTSLTQQDVRTTLTLEALADVDTGRFVEHGDVKAWADSLSTENQLPLPK